MVKSHEGECVDIDPFIPTGQCSICTGVEQDLTVPEERPGGEFEVVPEPEPTLDEPETSEETPVEEESTPIYDEQMELDPELDGEPEEAPEE